MGNKKSKNADDANNASVPVHDKEVDVSVVMLKIGRARKKVLDYVIHDIVHAGFYIPHYKRYKLTKEQVLLLWPDTSTHDVHVADLYEGGSVSVVIAVKEKSRNEMIELTKRLQQDHLENKEDVIMCSQSDKQAAREIAVLFPEIVASRDLQDCRMSHDEELRMEAWQEVVVKLNTQRNGATESTSFTNRVVDALIDCYEETGPPTVAVHEIPHKFPEVFDMYHWVREPLACGNGWYSLVYDTAKELDRIGKAYAQSQKGIPTPVHEMQLRLVVRHIVKDEKTGMLRIHSNAAELGPEVLEEVEQLIFKASHESGRICELCGQPGRNKKSLAEATGQARVLCKHHQTQMKAMVQERMQSIQAAHGDGDTGVLTNDFDNDDDEPYEIEVNDRLSKHEYDALRKQIEKANRIAVRNAEKKREPMSGSAGAGAGGGGGGGGGGSKKKKKRATGQSRPASKKKSGVSASSSNSKKSVKKSASAVKKKKKKKT